VFPAEVSGLFHEHRVTPERTISVTGKVSKNEETTKVEYAYRL